MTEKNSANHIVAFREFCYRWTCMLCSEVNRCAELSPSDQPVCDTCGEQHYVAMIKYDNGAVSRVVTGVKTNMEEVDEDE